MAKDNKTEEEIHNCQIESSAIESICYMLSGLESMNFDTKPVDVTALMIVCSNMANHINNVLADL